MNSQFVPQQLYGVPSSQPSVAPPAGSGGPSYQSVPLVPVREGSSSSQASAGDETAPPATKPPIPASQLPPPISQTPSFNFPTQQNKNSGNLDHSTVITGSGGSAGVLNNAPGTADNLQNNLFQWRNNPSVIPNQAPNVFSTQPPNTAFPQPRASQANSSLYHISNGPNTEGAANTVDNSIGYPGRSTPQGQTQNLTFPHSSAPTTQSDVTQRLQNFVLSPSLNSTSFPERSNATDSTKEQQQQQKLSSIPPIRTSLPLQSGRPFGNSLRANAPPPSSTIQPQSHPNPLLNKQHIPSSNLILTHQRQPIGPNMLSNQLAASNNPNQMDGGISSTSTSHLFPQTKPAELHSTNPVSLPRTVFSSERPPMPSATAPVQQRNINTYNKITTSEMSQPGSAPSMHPPTYTNIQAPQQQPLHASQQQQLHQQPQALPPTTNSRTPMAPVQSMTNRVQTQNTNLPPTQNIVNPPPHQTSHPVNPQNKFPQFPPSNSPQIQQEQLSNQMQNMNLGWGQYPASHATNTMATSRPPIGPPLAPPLLNGEQHLQPVAVPQMPGSGIPTRNIMPNGSHQQQHLPPMPPGSAHLHTQPPSQGLNAFPPPPPQSVTGPPTFNAPPMGAQGVQPPTVSPSGMHYPPQVQSYPHGSPYQQQQQQQQKRLDPDQMPNPIQVMLDDQKSRSGEFYTNQKGLVPPLVTTTFRVQDQGNCSPRYIRSTMYSVPCNQDMMKQTGIPFALAISPMARLGDDEYPPPIVDFGQLGPVRCIRCKAYMCPFMQFIDSGRRFQCLFCKATTDVPSEYFQHLDHTGQRMDRMTRPELMLGAYEYVATTDYCRNNVAPKVPAMVFVIDVSYNNVKSGLVHLLCSQMKTIIKNLPVENGHDKSLMRVGFITYNSSVHFYNINGSLAAPQMMVVGDVHEMFMPLLDGFLCTPEESEAVIDALMQQIPLMFGDTKETEVVLLPAILAGLEALKASECAGKLLVFHSTMPTADAPGRLKNRDDRKLLGTDKEKTVLVPQTQAYNNLGQECVSFGCCVDLFVFNNAYADIATIGQVARLTGGEVFKYTYFQADIDGDRLINDIIMDISRPIAFEGIMRVRTSAGVRPTDFYGNFFMSNTTDMELGAIDCDKAVTIEIKHDDRLGEDDGVYIQTALLYTSCTGQRRLRILNLSLKTCVQLADLFRSCECDTIINYMAKQAVYRLYEHSPKAVKEGLVNRAAQILASYRKHCANPSSQGQLILPECMKLLPLYVNCILKSDAVSGGADLTLDDRAFVMQQVISMDIPTSVNFFYPTLLPLHELLHFNKRQGMEAANDVVNGGGQTEERQADKLMAIRCTVDKLQDNGVYLLENGIHMFIWIGLNAPQEFLHKVFGVPTAGQINVEQSALPLFDNPLSRAVATIIETARMQRHRSMRLTLVRQREKMEPVFKHFLAEDHGVDGSQSYVEFLIHMHKEIRNLLS